MRILRPFRVVALLSLALWGGTATAASFKVDPAKSTLVVQTFKEGVAAAVAHDHVVRATQFSGQVDYDPAGAAGSIVVEVKTSSLQVDEPAVRKKYGLPDVSEGDSKKAAEAMRSEEQLAIAKFPTITFKSTSIQKQANGQYSVTGDLTIRGKTQSVTFPATVEMKDGNFHGKGQLKFKQSSFGYEPYSALFGAIRVQDPVVMNISLVATP